MLVGRAFDELRAAGLATGDRLDADLLDTLGLLAGAGREVFGWFSPDGAARHSAVVASTGQDAVVAVTDGTALALTPIRPTALIESAVQVLPARPAARHHSVMAPLGAIEAARRGRAGGRDGAAARTLVAILRRPRRGGGQLNAAIQDRGRAGSPLTYLDTDEGRTLLTTSPGADGRSWLTAVPGTDQQLTEHLRRLLP